MVATDVSLLLQDLAGILAPFEVRRIGLVGIGRLGEALLNHRSFLSENYEVTAVFDSNPAKVGRVYAGKKCYDIADMPRVIAEKDISVIILTVPASAGGVPVVQVLSRAVYYSRTVKSVTLPESVTELCAEVFLACPELTIRAREGSAGAAHAKQFGIPLELI